MTTKSVRGLAALIAAAALFACGGGGSDGGTSSPPPGSSATSPLLLDASTTTIAAALAPSTGEAMLSIARFAVDSVRRFARPGTTSPQTESCPNGGLLTVTMLDRDGNGIASAVDRISVTARDCAVPVVTDIVNGTFEVELTAATSPPGSGFKGTIVLGSGLTFGAASEQHHGGPARLDAVRLVFDRLAYRLARDRRPQRRSAHRRDRGRQERHRIDPRA